MNTTNTAAVQQLLMEWFGYLPAHHLPKPRRARPTRPTPAAPETMPKVAKPPKAEKVKPPPKAKSHRERTSAPIVEFVGPRRYWTTWAAPMEAWNERPGFKRVYRARTEEAA